MSVWDKHANRWEHIGFPTRPSAEDARIFADLASAYNTCCDQTKIIVLGVTPEVVGANWPHGSVIEAVDMNPWMIENVYMPHPTLKTSVTLAHWQSMPMEDKSIDLIVGDGIFTPLETKDDYDALFCEMKRVLKPGGVMIVRAFLRPVISETIDSIVKKALDGSIKYFGSLKWRIAMSMIDAQFSVKASEIHRVFEENFPDRKKLESLSGWEAKTIETIDSYKETDSIFTFPTLNQLTNLSQNYTRIVDMRYGNYELSIRCPIVVFQF